MQMFGSRNASINCGSDRRKPVLHFPTRVPRRGKTLATPASTSQIWRFGVFEVDTHRVELRRSGTPVKLREQSFIILVYLLEHTGEIVTREELRSVLWPSDTYVDFDHSLNTAMMKLREALRDSTDTPLYIETIPKRGYRFIAPVTPVEDPRNGIAHANGIATPPAMDANGSVVQATVTTEMQTRHRRFRLATAIAGLVILVAAGILIAIRSRHPQTTGHEGGGSAPGFKIVPIMTAAGDPWWPTISPNGVWIAYMSVSPERKHSDIYVQLLGSSEKPLRLTNTRTASGSVGDVGRLAWSPDGTQIAFTRCDGKNNGVYVVPALGGDERKLTNGGCLYSFANPVAWFSEGKEMLMVDYCSAAHPFGVVLFSLVTGEKRCLTDFGAMKNFNCGLWFSLSPDGKTVAFRAPTGSAPCQGDIYTIPVSGGAPHSVTTDGRSSSFMWTPDSKSIVFWSARTTLYSLWRVSANGGTIEREIMYPDVGSFSPDGHRFVYTEETGGEMAIWRADLAAAGGPVLQNRKLSSTQSSERDAQPSPDGARIAWMSFRSGSREIWVGEAAGGNPRQLTHLDTYSGTPRWSPDGQSIAFDNYDKGSSQILVIDAEGRNLHPITAGPNRSVVPMWSRDGKSIYFASNRTGTWQVWKHSLENGSDVQVTKHGGFDAFESYDGRILYFSRFETGGLWSLPANGGPETLVVADKPQSGFWGYWAVTQAGLYLLDANAKPGPRIEFYDFATRRISPVFAFEREPLGGCPSLGATADGKTIYYAQGYAQGVINMMEMAD
jgi:Tol biopolymer transport system component/DNA-binding winged helix-turn-helix (wHTH) protein